MTTPASNAPQPNVTHSNLSSSKITSASQKRGKTQKNDIRPAPIESAAKQEFKVDKKQAEFSATISPGSVKVEKTTWNKAQIQDMTADQARDILSSDQIDAGEYILRTSSDGKHLSLSMKSATGEIKHERIEVRDTGYVRQTEPDKKYTIAGLCKIMDGIGAEYKAEYKAWKEAESILMDKGVGEIHFSPDIHNEFIVVSMKLADGSIKHEKIQKADNNYQVNDKRSLQDVCNRTQIVKMSVNNTIPILEPVVNRMRGYGRKEAETELQGKVGEFVIREGSDKTGYGSYAVSFAGSEGVFHMQYQKTADPDMVIFNFTFSKDGLFEYYKAYGEVEKLKLLIKNKAVGKLLNGAENLPAREMHARLQNYNAEIQSNDPTHWSAPPSHITLFTGISSPEPTRLNPSVHANWLTQDRSIAGIMYPTAETRDQLLTAFYENGITRHAHLANHFVILLQNPTAVPMFPFSKKTFELMQKGGGTTIMTEIGPVTIKANTISDGLGSFTITGKVNNQEVTREVTWPLDSLQLSNGIGIELQSSGDWDTYVYKKDGSEVHTLEVAKMLWQDFGAASITELHKTASWLEGAKCRSVGCRAGVGRTGTLFVATKMLEWVGQNPGQSLTRSQVLAFIAEGRYNRDPQIVQTEGQVSMLIEYMNYLNSKPDLPLRESVNRIFKLPEVVQKSSTHIAGKGLRDLITKHPNILELLSNPNRARSREDDVALDEFFLLLSCPLTLELPKDPVLAVGHTYERAAITKWIREHRTSPLTRESLELTDIKADVLMKEVQAMLIKRAAQIAPRTEEGIAKLEELKGQLMNEPIKWCRILSAVMPKGKYFVRAKGTGGTNDFVIEIRGDKQVIKAGFRVNDEGSFQLIGHDKERSFKNIQDLAEALTKDKISKKPTQVTQDEINALNMKVGKQQLTATLYENETLMDVIKHLEQMFDDDKISEYLGNQRPTNNQPTPGYVRASLQPCSFPCFTYLNKTWDPDNNKYKESRIRVCISNGNLCEVKARKLQINKNISKELQLEHWKQSIDSSNDSPAVKQQLKNELDAIQGELDFKAESIYLFRPTDNPIPVEELELAELNPQEVKERSVNNYIPTFPMGFGRNV